MNATILLADDSLAIHRVVELTFAGQDLEVVSVSDGEQAIARIQDLRPDVVLADIGMPKRTGYDVAAFVKNHPDLSHIPVLLLAGAFEPVDDARVAELGCADVLVKPFDPQKLLARVRELLAGEAAPPAAPRLAAVPRREEPPADEAALDIDRTSALIEALPGFDAWDVTPEPDAPASAAAAPEGPADPPELPAVLEISRFERIDTPSAPPLPGPDSSDEALEDYFDRLDAAFATLGNTASEPAPPGPPPAPPAADAPSGNNWSWTDQQVPTMDELLASMPTSSIPAPANPFDRVALPPVEPPDMSPTLSPDPSDAGRDDTRSTPVDAGRDEAPWGAADRSGERNAIVDVFHLLFAVEQGEADPSRVRVGPGGSSTPVAAGDDLVDEVTRRVLERLAPDTARAVVADIVADVAERLVRQEIDRIRNAQ